MSFGDAMKKAMDSVTIEPSRGTYKMRLDESSAFEYTDKKTGDPREAAKVILEIVEFPNGATYVNDDGATVPVVGGERVQHFMGFSNEIAKQINGEALASYGVKWTEVVELSDLDDQLAALVRMGTTADVGVSYKDGYVQIKVHGSRTAGVSDIPSDLSEQPASFAAAAGQDNDDVSWMS